MGHLPFPLAVEHGGTEKITLTANAIIVGNGTGTPSEVTGAANQVLRIPGAGGAPAFGAVDLAQSAAVTGALVVANGGTGAVSLTGVLKGNGTSAFTTVTAPTGTIVGTSDTQTLTNKTLVDSSTTLQDEADATKQARFQLSSIATATTRTFTLPDVDDTIVTLTATQILTNKTLTAPTINTPTITVLDTALTLQDNVDTTKQAKFELSGITTATTRTFTLPDSNDTIVVLAATQTLTNKTLTTPTIASFVNATHNHQAAAGGGTLDAAAIAAGVLPVTRGGTGRATAFAVGSIVFAGTDGVYSQDEDNIFWDDANNWLGIGTNVPSNTLHVAGTLKLVDGSQAANRVLTSDANGLAAWQSISTISGAMSWVKISKVMNDFDTAATSNSINIYGLAAGGVVHAVKVKSSAAATGTGLTTYTISVGVSGDNAKYMSVYELFGITAGDTEFKMSNVLGSENHGSIVQITATAISNLNLNDATLNNATIDFWLLVSTAT